MIKITWAALEKSDTGSRLVNSVEHGCVGSFLGCSRVCLTGGYAIYRFFLSRRNQTNCVSFLFVYGGSPECYECGSEVVARSPQWRPRRTTFFGGSRFQPFNISMLFVTSKSGPLRLIFFPCMGPPEWYECGWEVVVGSSQWRPHKTSFFGGSQFKSSNISMLFVTSESA